MSSPPTSPATGTPEPGPTEAAGRREALFFALALAVYAATRLICLTRFPIFFFTDEAVQANAADHLFRNHFRDAQAVLLPPYFLNDQRWAMSLNVYLLVAPVILLGKTILVTRGTFAAVAILGAAALGLALRTAGLSLWWSAPLLLAALPVDFLHSRMALETTPAFYAAFLAAYLLYRLRSPSHVFLTLLAGAATFYSYTAGQGIMLVTGLLLLAADARYHLRQPRKLLAAAALFLLLLAAPFLRERHRHPDSTRQQLLVLHSYWVAPGPLRDKLETFGRTYLSGFDPRYWFLPNEAELLRHRTDGMAYAPLALAPFVAVGLGSCLWRFRRSPGHRVILLSPLGVPLASAFHVRQVLRVLPMVVPIVLLAAIGLEEVVRLLRRLLPSRALAVGLAAVLTLAAARLTLLCLTEGSTWYRNYGLYGMQYGAKQVFDGIHRVLSRSPHTHVLLTSTWANNPDEFLDFFLSGAERGRASMGGIDTWRLRRTPLSRNDLFVLTEEEYEQARRDPKLVVGRPEYRVLYPDGLPGFSFVRIAYAENADALFAAEREARRRLQEETVTIGGQAVRVRHSMTDLGRLPDLFDGRFDSTLRGLEANPFVLEFEFPSPRTLSKIDLLITRMECNIRVEVTPAEGGNPRVFTKTVRNQVTDSEQQIPFPDGPIRASKVRLEILEPFVPEPAHVELREITFS